MRPIERTDYTNEQVHPHDYTERADYADVLIKERTYGEAANRGDYKPKAEKKKKAPKHKLALLIAAHNEELVIEQTLRSAIKAGMDPKHIYVVDDNSTDKTRMLAASIIPRENTIKVRRSGKGLALTKAAKHFKLVKRYQWIHIADADGGFAQSMPLQPVTFVAYLVPVSASTACLNTPLVWNCTAVSRL
jgi:hypothetical protein